LIVQIHSDLLWAASEQSKKNVDNIQQNINTFGLKNCDVIHQDAHQFISSSKNKYDLIFFDPPYASKYYLWLDDVAKKILAPQGIIYLESSKTVESNVLKAIKHKKTKSLYYGIYEQVR
jgi:16S rRNA (guanine966-N2)-methyltransferase